MLNKDQQRELAYVVIIDEIKPIPGRDRVECAVVNGWTVMVRKGQFKPGDPGIYFEIDSKTPETEPFTFLAPKHYKVKTQKYKNSDGTYFWSQGLLMSAEDFGWVTFNRITYEKYGFLNYPGIGIYNEKDKEIYLAGTELGFLTKKLNITYAVAEDNKRKSNIDKYKIMAQRKGKLFSHQPFRWLMKRNWGKKLLFLFFGKKKDKKSSWPSWIPKTDEERIQNMPWILKDKEPWIVTEKIDGTSTTFAIKRKKFNRYDFYICSRNVVFDKPDKKCFYETNVYTEMAEKYKIEKEMKRMLDTDFSDCDWIIIQGETYGPGIQKRDYSILEHSFKAFNLIDSKKGRWNTKDMKNILTYQYGIPCVPIVKEDYILPDTIEEILDYATGMSYIDSKMREGYVFRDKNGEKSFKAVSNEYLVKYHG